VLKTKITISGSGSLDKLVAVYKFELLAVWIKKERLEATPAQLE